MTRSRPAPLDSCLVRDAYDLGAEELARRFPDVGVEAPLDLAMVDAFATAVGTGDDARVLDAGCGGGRMSGYLAARGRAVEGVDLSPGMVAMARRDHPDLTFSVGSLSDLPYAEGEFAGVLLWYSIIHIRPPGLERVFAEVARVLRPHGHVLVGFQSGEGTRGVTWAHQRGMPLDRHLYTVGHLASASRTAGLGELCRLVRRARGLERDDQCFVLLRAAG